MSRMVCLSLMLVLVTGIILRVYFITNNVGAVSEPDFGGDACHHYSIAKNISDGQGPKTSFIFSYWFHHPDIPAVTDVYTPGCHYVMAAFMKLFSNDFFGARLASFVLGMFSLILLMLIGFTLNAPWAGVFAAGILAFNLTHIEHSVVVMTPVIATFFILASILSLCFIGNKSSASSSIEHLTAGFIIGVTHLCQSVGALFLGLWVLNTLLTKGKAFWRDQGLWLVFVGFLGAILPWAIYTKLYFGKFLYSGLSYTLWLDDWQRMYYETSPPQISLLNESGAIALFLKSHFFHVVIQAITLSIPIGVGSLGAWIFCLILLLGVVRALRTHAGRLMVILFVLIVVGLVLGSRARFGMLQPRHVMPLIALIGLGFGFGADLLLQRIKKADFKILSNKPAAVVLSICMIVALAASYTSHVIHVIHERGSAFWKLDSPSFKETVAWIDKNTAPTDRIMYALTPQDLSCWANRQVVVDPSLSGGDNFRFRAKEEVKYYGVKYLMLDNSTDIYDRVSLLHVNIENVDKYYPGLDLSLVYKHPSAPIYIYSVKLQ